MITVTLYFKNQSEAEIIRKDLLEIREQIPFDLVMMDITQEAVLENTYRDIAPVVRAGPYQLKGTFTKQELWVMISSARDRDMHLQTLGDEGYRRRKKRGETYNSGDRFTNWLTRNYMWIIIGLLAVYVGLPFLAPVLMKNGKEWGANLIYKMYSVMCHQTAFRSWFLFGEQAAYPSELAHLDEYMTYEEIMGIRGARSDPATDLNLFVLQAREFIGNAQTGYKVALCERDIAMYGSLLLFGLIFVATGRRIPPLSWKVWILIGILPIAIDGVSQLPGFLTWIPINLPYRESTPFLRTLTGFLFGITTGWYLFPVIEETMMETRRALVWKNARSQQATGGGGQVS